MRLLHMELSRIVLFFVSLIRKECNWKVVAVAENLFAKTSNPHTKGIR